MSGFIQSYLFPKTNFSLDEAIQYASVHNYKYSKIDVTTNYYRFRNYDAVYLRKKLNLPYIKTFTNKINGIQTIFFFRPNHPHQ